MLPRDAQRQLGKIDAGHLRASGRHGFGQDAAAAADVQRLAVTQAGEGFDPLQPMRVDAVQRAELRVFVPPAIGQGIEAGQFGGICIAMGAAHDGSLSVELGLAVQ